MIEYRAQWVVPVATPPIVHGAVVVEGDRVVAVDRSRAIPVRSPKDAGTVVDLGRVAILPGLVNAHTHLELSWLKGRIPPVSSFPAWIRHVLSARREQGRAGGASDLAAMDSAIDEARRFGTILVGDISNTLLTFDRLIARSMRAVVFHELIGFNPPDARAMVDDARSRIDRLGSARGQRATLAAHAPYSVSPDLFRCIDEEVARLPSVPTSVHLAESVAEIEFLHTGTGPWRELLEELGGWDPSWRPPDCGPVEYLARLGFLGPRVIVVHGVQLTFEELGRLAAARATLVTCPRGNENTAAGPPPIADFFRSGVRVALGTDSLASVNDLNLFAELAALRRLAPGVPASALLQAATIAGAEALGFGEELGTIAPGKSADLLAVDAPADVEDVEEYLVSGVDPSRIRWIKQ